ncbi:MAG: hypothetical protein IT559_07180 [Alphaproteobacteria bacterium]|nr:hypothetical protein [Alphaproteobacteria bacterium]
MKTVKRAKESPFDGLVVDVFLNNPNVAEFVGKNFEHYKTLWLKDYAKKKAAKKMLTCIHWNTLALLLWPAWFAYRKMIKFLVILCVLTAALSFAEEYWNLGNGSGVGITGGMLVMALLSKSFYFSHVVEKINAIESMPDPEQRAIMLEKQGGTSIAYAVLGVLFFVLTQVLALYLGSSLKPGEGAI